MDLAFDGMYMVSSKIHFLRYKIIGAPKNCSVPYLGLKTSHTCHPEPNPSRETVPLVFGLKEISTYHMFQLLFPPLKNKILPECSYP
jgi:hypothetical protein